MSAKNEKGTILVFDPDPISVTAIAAVIYGQGHECFCARSPAAAVKAAEQALDLAVLEVEGTLSATVELLHEIRRRGRTPELPAVLLAGADEVAASTPPEPNSGVTLLTKPYDPNALVQLVAQSLWMPHLVRGHRRRGTRPQQAGWLSL